MISSYLIELLYDAWLIQAFVICVLLHTRTTEITEKFFASPRKYPLDHPGEMLVGCMYWFALGSGLYIAYWNVWRTLATLEFDNSFLASSWFVVISTSLMVLSNMLLIATLSVQRWLNVFAVLFGSLVLCAILRYMFIWS
jgi:hypothetical protein